jgi:hypothetical protein
MERVNRCKINNSTVVKIGKKIAGEDSMRRSAISVRESKKRGQQSEKGMKHSNLRNRKASK